MSLFEILISFLLFSLSLLGLNAMEIFALHKTIDIYCARMADKQIENMAERLRMVSAEGGRDAQVVLWNQENQAVLPRGVGTVQGEYPRYTVTLCWNKKSADDKHDRKEHAGCRVEKIIL